MRITCAILAAAIAAFAGTAAPVMAKHSEAQKAAESSAAAPCSAYQQAPDGSWTQMPCKETDERATQHKPAAQGTEPEAR
jgi:hypothetical protein